MNPPQKRRGTKRTHEETAKDLLDVGVDVRAMGKAAKDWRELHGKTQPKAAENCGMDRGTLYRFEEAEVVPTLITCVRVATMMGVSLDRLVFGRESVWGTDKRQLAAARAIGLGVPIAEARGLAMGLTEAEVETHPVEDLATLIKAAYLRQPKSSSRLRPG